LTLPCSSTGSGEEGEGEEGSDSGRSSSGSELGEMDEDDGYYAEGKDWGGVWGEGEGEGPGDLEVRGNRTVTDRS